MKCPSLILFLCLLPLQLAFANCDLSHFRWNCDVPIQLNPNRTTHALIYCGNTPLYVNDVQYKQLVRYQRAKVNTILTINGEYVDSPCILAGREGPT